MNKINYQKELEHLIDKLPDHHRRLFLHSCCAPCSSYCLEYLRQYFDVDGILLQSKHQLFGGIPASGGGIKTFGEHAE